MYKLVILIEAPVNWEALEKAWPDFLHHAERMPGLVREASCRVVLPLSGQHYIQVHELFFETLAEAEEAMASPEGRATGRLLQQVTGGKLTLFIAEHKEDSITAIRRYQKQVQSSNDQR
jgi:hypothetical protein